MNVLGFGREKWRSGVVENIVGPVTFQVKLEDGKLVKRHANQMPHKYNTDCPVGETASTGEGQGNDQIDPKDLLPPVLIPPPLNSDRVHSPDSESSERSSEDPVNISIGNDAPSVDKLPQSTRMLEPSAPQQESRVASTFVR